MNGSFRECGNAAYVEVDRQLWAAERRADLANLGEEPAAPPHDRLEPLNYLMLPFEQMSDVDKNVLSAGKIFHRVETTRSQSVFRNSFAAALTGSSQGSVQSSFHTPRNR